MQPTVYWGSGSPVSWRVLLALAIKKVPYHSHRLDLSAKEFRSAEYLALNPRGTFPLFVADDLRVRGSLAILNTLEKLHPTPALLGQSASESAQIWQGVDDHEEYIGPAAETLTRAFFRKNGDPSPSNIDGPIKIVSTELRSLEEQLSSPWLVPDTDTISAVDIVYYPTIQRLLRVAARPDATPIRALLGNDLCQFPKLAQWLQRVTELPGVDATYPPHWR